MGKSRNNEECLFDPDSINAVFSSHFLSSQDSRPTFSRHENSDYDENRLEFKPILNYEVVDAVYEVKSNAAGVDGISMKFLKIILPLVIDHVTWMFNNIMSTAVFPSAWKKAKVLPLRKKKRLNCIENLRPISLLCVLSKVFEKLLKRQVVAHIERFNLLSDQQAGFRKGQSVKTALLRVYDDIAVAVDNKNKVVLLLLDFSKAFDTISHSKLCSKLYDRYFFSRTAVNLIRSYLIGKTQVVVCDDKVSKSAAVISGVPQGSVLGPVLFTLYIDDLPNVLRYCRAQLFADDVQLVCICPGKSPAELLHLVNEDLTRLHRWAMRNNLRINHSKSKALLFGGTRHEMTSLPAVNIDGNLIELTSDGSNLGLVFQNNLKWDKAVSQQCGKIYCGLRTLRAVTKEMPVHTKLQLFKSLLLPYFMFADIVYMNMNTTLSSKLEVALNDCVRYVYNINRWTSVRHLQKTLLGCPFRNFHGLRACLFLHKLLNRRAPNYLFAKLTSLQGRRTMSLSVPMHNTALYGESFFVKGVVFWNSLPPDLKRICSEAMFKKGCTTFFNQL